MSAWQIRGLLLLTSALGTTALVASSSGAVPERRKRVRAARSRRRRRGCVRPERQACDHLQADAAGARQPGRGRRRRSGGSAAVGGSRHAELSDHHRQRDGAALLRPGAAARLRLQPCRSAPRVPQGAAARSRTAPCATGARRSCSARTSTRRWTPAPCSPAFAAIDQGQGARPAPASPRSRR